MAGDGGNTELEIVASLVDEASAQMAEMADNISADLNDISEASSAVAEQFDANSASMDSALSSVSTAAEATASAVSAASLDQEASFQQLAEIMQATTAEQVELIQSLGVTAEEAAATIAEADASIAASGEETEASVATSSGGIMSSFTQIGVSAGLAFIAVKDAITSAISNGQQWAVSTAIIQQELKDTGSSIPVSQIQNYATQLQNVTLYSQNDILQSEQLLLSHKNLQSSYQSLTELSADLATKMGSDLPSATRILANALSDPVAGVNQLVRTLGVDLSAAQVSAIQNFAKVGDTAEADNLIIKDLNGQVGGLALAAGQASDTGLTKLSNAAQELSDHLGKALSPAVEDLFNKLDPVVQKMQDWIDKHPQLTAQIAIVVLAITGLISGLTLLAIPITAIGTLITTLSALVGVSFGSIFLVFAAFTVAAIAIGLAVYAIYENWKPAMQELSLLWDILKDDIETIWNDIKLYIDKVSGDLQKDLTTALNNITSIWNDVWNGIETFTLNIWDQIAAGVKTGVNDVIDVINGFINAIDSIHISLPPISIPGTKISTPAVDVGFSINDIPHLATGGIVDNPTIALIGESGPEAVIPLPSGGVGGIGGNQGGTQIIVNINGGTYMDQNAAKTMSDMIARTINQQVKLRTT